MRDALGNELAVGDWVLYPGSGNSSAEYGMILYRVEDVEEDRIKGTRLYSHYNPNRITSKISTIKSGGKLVIVNPPENMIKVFNEAILIPTNKYFDLISSWIHGRTDIDWDNLRVGKMRD